LEVAEKLFAENGYQGTSVRTIAEKADTNVAMISYYFGSKRNLLKELSFYRTSDFRKEVRSLLAQSDDYMTKVDVLIAFIIHRLHRKRRIHKITNFEYSKNSTPGDFEHFIKQRQKNYNIIEEFI